LQRFAPRRVREKRCISGQEIRLGKPAESR
jgi:hypothetical protein